MLTRARAGIIPWLESEVVKDFFAADKLASRFELAR